MQTKDRKKDAAYAHNPSPIFPWKSKGYSSIRNKVIKT